MLFPLRQEGFDIIGGILCGCFSWKKQNLPSSTQNWSFRYHPTFNMFHVTCQAITPDYLQDYFLEAEQGGRGSPLVNQRGTDRNHLMTTLGCKALLQYHQKQFRLKIPSFRTFFQARSVIPPDFTGCYLVNHPHPVDSSQQGVLPMSSHFLLKAFLTSRSQDWHMSQ